MEFLDENKALESLTNAGLAAHQTPNSDETPGDLRLAPDSKAPPAYLSIGAPPDSAAAHALQRPDAPAVAGALDDVLHALHIQEAIAIPVKPWRSALDAVAFDLATDEPWQLMDAEASLHQRSRDPLEFPPAERATLLAIARAILVNAEDSSTDITILAPGMPIVIELRHPAELRVTAADPALIEDLAQRLKPA